jgi:hypothetical protein
VTDEINTILDAYHSTTLWVMAIAAGLAPRGGKKPRKAELLSKMRAEFFTQERVFASWEQLGKRERAVLNRLLLRGGSAPTRSFQREVVRAKLATPAEKSTDPESYYYRRVPYSEGYAGDPGRTRSTIFEDIIARLTYHGLVFSRDVRPTSGGTPYKLQFHPAATLYIPQVIQRFLPEPVPVDAPDLQPVRVEAGEPALLLRDLYLYWDFVRRNEVSLVQSGLVGKRWLKAINNTLLVPDPSLDAARREDETSRLYLLRRFLESLKLVRGEGANLRPTGKDKLHIPPFWSRTLTEQMQACLEAWPQLSGPKDLGSEASTYSPGYPRARQVVLEVLKTLPPDVWFEVDDFLERVQGQDVDFLFPEHGQVENYRGIYYYSHAGGGYYSGAVQTLLETFEELEAKFVNVCLTGILRELGVVELGYGLAGLGDQHSEDDGDRLGAFRVTPTGQAMLSGEPTEQSPDVDEGKLVVQPNFQLMAIGPVSLSLLATLDLFAEREQVDQSAFQYRLSREAVYGAQQLGMDVADVVRFLTTAGSVELPQNVRRSLEEWGAHHERIAFRTGLSLLQAADADLLGELMEGASTGRLLARSLAPEVALIKQNQQDKLVSALVEQGLLPAVSGAQPGAADKSVIIQEDGMIRPVHAVPSLHLRGRLARLAEKTGGDGWHLTPASVRRAGGSRDKVLRLLEELGRLHRGSLPDSLVEQIKAWGGYYGDAAAETLTLIELHDRTVLDELAQHPELQAYLTPFSAGERALAIVHDEKLAQVKEILARFGVRVTDGLRR